MDDAGGALPLFSNPGREKSASGAAPCLLRQTKFTFFTLHPSKRNCMAKRARGASRPRMHTVSGIVRVVELACMRVPFHHRDTAPVNPAHCRRLALLGLDVRDNRRPRVWLCAVEVLRHTPSLKGRPIQVPSQ